MTASLIASVELVEWSTLSDAHREAVRMLNISPQQVEFAGTVDLAIAKREAHQGNDLVGLAAVVQGSVIGFLLLMRASEAPPWSQAHWAALTSMRIDANLQGKGLGTAMLLAVRQWVRSHWETCTHIALVVDEDNHAGMRAYAKAGFTDLGKREQGRIGWVRYMVAAASARVESAV